MIHIINRILNRVNIRHYTLFIYNIICIGIFSVLYYVSDKVLNSKSHSKKLNVNDALYFSVVTQTTLGYGDIVPTHSITRFLVILQCLSILAILYLL